jgi:hypothetical protein
MRLRCDRCGAPKPAGTLHDDAGLQLCGRCYAATVARPKVRYVVIAAAVLVAAVAVVRGARGAEQHPGMTADHPPGWQLQRALPGEKFKPRGKYFDNKNGCPLDLASDRWATPSGTRLVCLHIEKGTVR